MSNQENSNQEPCKGCGRIHGEGLDPEVKEATDEELAELSKPFELTEDQKTEINGHIEALQTIFNNLKVPYILTYVHTSEINPDDEDDLQSGVSMAASLIPKRTPDMYHMLMGLMQLGAES